VVACGLLVALLTACIVTRNVAAPMLARSDSVSAAPLVDVVPAAGNIGQRTLTRVAENGNTLSFVIEADSTVCLCVAPRQWAVRAAVPGIIA
jgi:hypothetical protein